MALKRLGVMMGLAASLAACAKSPVDAAGSATVTTPGLVSPANGAQIPNAAQPVTLTINNGLVTQADAAVSYTFEVATDAAFGTKVATKDATQGANQTSAKLDTLAAGKDYFWRVRTVAADTQGAFTAPIKFTIGAAVTLPAPASLAPTDGVTVNNQTPDLVVTNIVPVGPAGAITYRFDVSANSSFNPILETGTVAQGTSQNRTTFVPSKLASDTQYFWRAQAIDASNSVTGPFSVTRAFRTVESIDLTKVNFQRFVNVTNWPVTNKIIEVYQDGATGDMCINHAKRGIWPAVPFFGDPDTLVESNQWYFAKINGIWYAGGGEYQRPSQICKAGQYTEQIGPDGTWGGPMDTWKPKLGELVGYMVTTPARNYPISKTLDERSDIVLVPWMINGKTQ